MLDALHRRRSEVMGAAEKRIVVKNLRARGLIVGIIQANQRVPEEGGESAARVFQLGRRALRTNDLGEIGSYLQFRVAAGVNDWSPGGIFTSREKGSGGVSLSG